ncbi:MAG: 1-(5-phosphoribosyl)-5-[(5-phosphoribosylamino)methylideneamino]imidazole-4-carboxamide isomerase [Candidatus Bathyarchaeota archaeon]
MKVIPAVDILGGRVVRLSKGEPQTAKTYNGLEEPLQAAKRWEREGANILHVVDLDAATGRNNNRQIIESIVKGVKIPVQVGGGIRSKALAEEMLTLGASRIIIATLAFEREDVAKALVDKFGQQRVMVALDYLNGLVMTKGWKGQTGFTLMKAMEKFSNLGIALFLLTSISRDGLLTGPDYATLKNMTGRFKKGLFVAGGIMCLDDLVRLKSLEIDGVVVGKAFYEERFTLMEAMEVAGV